MALSDPQQTEVVQSPANEKWVLLQGDSNAVNEQLLEEQDGDARSGKESIPNAVEAQLSPNDLEKFLWWCRYGWFDKTGVEENIRNAAERLESAQVTEKFFWWWRSAWNDAFVRKALWEDRRLHILIAVLSTSTVLHVLAALASLTESNALQALLICLKHFTTATLSAAAFSIATLFLSLTAVKASTLDKSRDADVLCFLYFTSFMILAAACYACIHEVGAGITVFQESRREETFGWFLQLLADMARVYVLTAAVVLSAALVFLMGTDVKVTLGASFLHSRMMKEYRKLVGRMKGRADRKASPYLMNAMLLVLFGMMISMFVDILFLGFSGLFAHPGHAAPPRPVTSRKGYTVLALRSGAS